MRKFLTYAGCITTAVTAALVSTYFLYVITLPSPPGFLYRLRAVEIGVVLLPIGIAVGILWGEAMVKRRSRKSN